MNSKPPSRDERSPGSGAGRMTEELLRRALSAEADGVEVSPDALERIRGRVARRRARWWLPQPGTLRLVGITAAVAAAVAAVVVGLGGIVPGDGTSGGPETNVAGGGRPVATANLPVYYLGPAAGGHRLYREYHPLAVGDGSFVARIEAALGAMLRVTPSDPDYGSPWPAGARVGRVSIEGDTATVDIDGAADNAGTDRATTSMALEQLVWTAAAATVRNGVTGVTGVVLRLDGHDATSLWGAPVGGQVLHRGPAVEVLAPVWVIDPQQGAVVGRGFTVNLAGIVPGATMRLRVRDSAGTVVEDRAVPLSVAAPHQGTATVRLNLASGSYTVEGYVVSGSDGSEQWLDRHRFTVS